MHLSPYYQTPPSAYEEPELGGHPYADSEYHGNELEAILGFKYTRSGSVITQMCNVKTLKNTRSRSTCEILQQSRRWSKSDQSFRTIQSLISESTPISLQ